MHRKLENKFIAITFLILFFAFGISFARGQQTTQLTRRCPGASPVVKYAKVVIEKDGVVNITPCNGKDILKNGSPFAASSGLVSINGLSGNTQTLAVAASDTASWLSTGSAHTVRLPITSITGTSRTRYFPIFGGENSFAKSPFSFDGDLYEFDNTSFNASFKMQFRPENSNGGKTSTGYFVAGEAGKLVEIDASSSTTNIDNSFINLGSGVSYLNISKADNEIAAQAQTTFFNTQEATFGDTNGNYSDTKINISNATGRITLTGRTILENSQPPSVSNNSCVAGTIAIDTSYIYVCTVTNNWKRSALSSF